MLSVQTDELLNAIKADDKARVNQLLETNPSLASGKDKDGVSLILSSLYQGRREIAEAIAAKKSKLDIFEAASLGSLESVKQMVEQDPSLVKAYSPDGFTALALAAYLGQKRTVEYLLGNGADVNAPAKNSTGFTALTGAGSQNHNEIAKILVRRGADVNHRYEGGFTPLMHAAHAGNLDLVTFLLENGAEPNVRMTDGNSALTFALGKSHSAVAETLRKHGAH